MKTNCLFSLLCLLSVQLLAQNPLPQPVNFTTTVSPSGLRFTPECPPLPPPTPGGREPFYTYYWEFGDGDFSVEKNPVHPYAAGGNYTAMLDATAHYDDKKKPPSKKRTVTADAGSPGQAMNYVFDEARQTIALKTNREPRPEEELVCIISYRNTSSYVTDGRLHLFFNEKRFPARHFTFLEARTHHNETAEADYSAAETPRVLDWSTLSAGWAGTGDATSPLVFAPPTPRTEAMLAKARDAYREEQTWRFSQLRPGESRNLFVSLGSTASMVKDTSVYIHLQGIVAPFDPAIPAGEFTLDIKIVSSHDPNAIGVSENRVNYRRLGSEKLDYKVQFQNNGEGPAKKIELTVTVPEGLNTTKMRPLNWYPECPICPPGKADAGLSCLDTATQENALIFTFRNIYLPGSKQEGLADYDSTKGFVRYRLEPAKHMPKRAFSSQAKIVFDKNKPIYTNFSKTRFKMGLSPGPKVGYAFRPDVSNSGYFFMGASLSPYKSWKFYPQVELLTGLRGRTELPETIRTDRSSLVFTDVNGFLEITDTLTSTSISGNRGFVSVEVPALMRKNISKFFGLGLGASAQVFFENGTDKKTVSQQVNYYENIMHPGGPVLIDSKPVGTAETTSKAFNSSYTRFTIFGDLTLGAVRAGPNLGIRAGGVFDRGFQPFIQCSLEVKL